MSSSNPYREHYSSEGQTQISARIDDDLKADIEQLADERGISQTDLICQSLAETVNDAGMIDAGTEIEPEDPTARELYRSMVDRMDPGEETGLTPIKHLLSQDTQIPSDQIAMWIQRLSKRGFTHIRASAPGRSVTRYAVAVKPPQAEPGEWSPYSHDLEPDTDEVTNAKKTIDEITDDADPITDTDPLTQEVEIDSSDPNFESLEDKLNEHLRRAGTQKSKPVATDGGNNDRQ